MRRPYLPVFMLAALIGGATAGPSGATADEVEDFYRNRTVNVNVPAGPGTGFSLFSKLLVDHMPAHTPGHPSMIPIFRPGAGGLLATAYTANVGPRDGSEITLLLAPTLLVAILNPQQAHFDARRLTWIGSMFPRTGAVWLWTQGPANSLEKAKQVETVLGSAGIGSETYQTPKLMNALLGTKFKIVTGYKSGAEINLAIERGEINGRQQNYLGWEAAGKEEWVRDHKVVPIIQTGPTEPALGNVPSFRDIVKPGVERQTVELHEIGAYIGLGVFTAPGIPPARADALRRAFMDTMRDPHFLDDAHKNNVVINPKSSDEIAGIVARSYGYPEAVRDRLRKAFNSKD